MLPYGLTQPCCYYYTLVVIVIKIYNYKYYLILSFGATPNLFPIFPLTLFHQLPISISPPSLLLGFSSDFSNALVSAIIHLLVSVSLLDVSLFQCSLTLDGFSFSVSLQVVNHWVFWYDFFCCYVFSLLFCCVVIRWILVFLFEKYSKGFILFCFVFIFVSKDTKLLL